LVSKKDVRRPGKRFLVRGIDTNGNVANFVETEHVITLDLDKILKIGTYIQTRGSIPLLWDQKPTGKWAPKVNISPNSD
jgi:hypothetical protein